MHRAFLGPLICGTKGSPGKQGAHRLGAMECLNGAAFPQASRDSAKPTDTSSSLQIPVTLPKELTRREPEDSKAPLA